MRRTTPWGFGGLSVLIGWLAVTGCKDEGKEQTSLPPPKNLVEQLERGAQAMSDPTARIYLWSGLAEAYLIRTQTSTASEILLEAETSLAQVTNTTEQAELRSLLAGQFGRVGALAKAKSLWNRVGDPFLRDGAKAQVVAHLVETGQTDVAEGLIKEIKNEEARSQAGLSLIEVFLTQGQPREAGRRIVTLRGLPAHDEALGRVATVLAQQKSYPAANDAAERITNPHWRGRTKIALAKIYFQVRKESRAERMISGIESDWLAARGWIELALEADKRASKRKRKKKWRKKARQYRAKYKVRFESIGEPLIQRSAKEDIAEVYIQNGLYEPAQATIAQLASREAQRKVLFVLLKAYLEQQRWADAQAILPEIEKDPVWGDRARVAMAKAWAFDDTDAALQFAARIQDQNITRRLLGEIAVAQVEAQLPLADEVSVMFDRLIMGPDNRAPIAK